MLKGYFTKEETPTKMGSRVVRIVQKRVSVGWQRELTAVLEGAIYRLYYYRAITTFRDKPPLDTM